MANPKKYGVAAAFRYTFALLTIAWISGCGSSTSTFKVHGVVVRVAIPVTCSSKAKISSVSEDESQINILWGMIKYNNSLNFTVSKNRLSINGQPYGELRAGDTVNISPPSTVVVNGMARPPVAVGTVNRSSARGQEDFSNNARGLSGQKSPGR